MDGVVLNVSEAARIAGVARQSVMKALATGRLEGLGTSPPTVTSEALERWMRQRGAGDERTPGVSGSAPGDADTSTLAAAVEALSRLAEANAALARSLVDSQTRILELVDALTGSGAPGGPGQR